MTPTTGAGRVAGKAALVTGGASGIGRAAALLLARDGAAVAVADVNEAGAASVAQELGRGAIPLRLDVTSEADWQAAVDGVVKAFGRLDVLVNSAGVAFTGMITDATLAEWRRVMAVNLDGVFLGTRAALRLMVPQGAGSVVNVASASGVKATPGGSAYGASKAAVIHFTRSAAMEAAQAGTCVRVNAVAPGGVKTPLWQTIPLGQQIMTSEEWAAPRTAPPHKRFAEPDEVAQAILFLASDESSYVTAACLAVDGGYTA
jgi:NAD(P)-dependent dehydrogenase (short-subunit alcohol dehydrogenase family)